METQANPPGFTRALYPTYRRDQRGAPATVTLWVSDSGVLYDEWSGFLSPAAGVPRRRGSNGEFAPSELQPGHRLDPTALMHCANCGTNRLNIFASGAYETSIRCPECRAEVVVHEG